MQQFLPYFGASSACSINLRIAGAGIAPAWRPTSNPDLKSAMVGMAGMRNFFATGGNFSVSTLMTSHFPASSEATFRISGATILHGPHHGAQKSTSTGNSDRL